MVLVFYLKQFTFILPGQILYRDLIKQPYGQHKTPEPPPPRFSCNALIFTSSNKFQLHF